MSPQHDEIESLWTARPGVARAIRAFVFIAPLAISIVVAWGLSAIAPRPTSFAAGVVRWVLIAFVSTMVLMAVDKMARRLLPLATLFGLTLAFPDQAPSRYQLALRNGSTTQLRVRIAEARAGKLGDTPAEAAERVLELVMALSVHDRLTRGHSERVRAYTQMIGEEMGLTDAELDRLRWAGLLHDVGKLMISGDILNKAGKLTAEEFETIKQHPEFGRRLVAPLTAWMGDAARAVWEHHERWDGNGYPRGLSTTDISIAGRIVSVADAYDVMTSARSYKKPISPAAARAELTRCSGTQFDPAVVRAFMNVSLGRLRIAMGPLTWLAQLPLFPSAVAATATQGAATAATVLVGAAAASVGLGIAGEPMLPQPDEVVAEAFVVARAPRDPYEIDTGPRSGVVVASLPGGEAVDSGGLPDDAPGQGIPIAVDGGRTSDGPGDVAATTTLGPLDDVVDDPPLATTTSSPSPGPTTSAEATTLAPTTTVVAAAATTTVALAPVTTPPPTTVLPTTTLPRGGWLPAPGVATSFFLELPGRVDLAGQPVLGLKFHAPVRPSGLAFDPDRDGLVGLTLARALDAQPLPSDRATFGWGGPSAAHLAGVTSTLVYVGSTQASPVDVVVRGRIEVCDGGNVCFVRSEITVTVHAGLEPVPTALDFGVVDDVIPAGGTVRLVLDVPSASASDAVVFADTSATPSALTLTFP